MVAGNCEASLDLCNEYDQALDNNNTLKSHLETMPLLKSNANCSKSSPVPTGHRSIERTCNAQHLWSWHVCWMSQPLHLYTTVFHHWAIHNLSTSLECISIYCNKLLWYAASVITEIMYEINMMFNGVISSGKYECSLTLLLSWCFLTVINLKLFIVLMFLDSY